MNLRNEAVLMNDTFVAGRHKMMNTLFELRCCNVISNAIGHFKCLKSAYFIAICEHLKCSTSFQMKSRHFDFGLVCGESPQKVARAHLDCYVALLTLICFDTFDNVVLNRTVLRFGLRTRTVFHC